MKYSIILLLFFVFSYLFRSDLSFDQDLGRHIKLGEIIFKTHSIPKVNTFSYTNAEFPFINTHWGFEVLAYFFSQTNLYSLLILKVVIFLFSVWLIFKIVPKEKSVLLLPFGFIFLHVLRERLELRPEIFSFLFTASSFFILEKFLRQKTKLIYLLPLIQLLWINTHIYFFVGFILQAIFLIHLKFRKEFSKLKFLAGIFLVSLILSLLNPNGLEGLLYPLTVNTNYGYSIVENQTIFFLEKLNFRDPNFLFVKLSWAIAGLSILFKAYKRKFDIRNILLILAGVGLSLLNVRSFPYLVFLSLPAVIENFGIIKSNGLTVVLTIITIPLLLLESFFYLNGDYYKNTQSPHEVGLSYVESVKGGMDFVLKNDLPNPIYNNFDIGSYITYRGYPKYSIFVDGRPEAYPKEFFTDIYIPTQYDFNKFKSLEQTFKFETIIFSITDQTPWGNGFLTNIIKDESWKTVYIDDFTIILVKDNVAKERNLSPINLSNLSPNLYDFKSYISYLRLGFFLNAVGNSNGNLFIQKAQQMVGNLSNNFWW